MTSEDRQILELIAKLQYGEIVIKKQGGKIVNIVVAESIKLK